MSAVTTSVKFLKDYESVFYVPKRTQKSKENVLFAAINIKMLCFSRKGKCYISQITSNFTSNVISLKLQVYMSI